MQKRSARSTLPDFNFAKAYRELKQLREDVALLERSLSSGRKTKEYDSDSLRPADDVQPSR